MDSDSPPNSPSRESDSTSFSEHENSSVITDSPMGAPEEARKPRRRPSLKDLFIRPLTRRRKSSSVNRTSSSPLRSPVSVLTSPGDSPYLETGPVSKKKNKSSKEVGCGSWLDKKALRKYASAESLSSTNSSPPTVAIKGQEAAKSPQDVFHCVKCFAEYTVALPPAGVTYNKVPRWTNLCPQCEEVTNFGKGKGKLGEKVSDIQAIDIELANNLVKPVRSVPRLADLVLPVLKRNPQVFTLTNLTSLKKRHELGPDGVEDMIKLSDLNEASLLWNLKVRYDKEMIYTYVGSILVAVNPYKMFDVYGMDMVQKYEGQILGTLPPHLFAVGSAAYQRLTTMQQSQVVVISGESGSGKTESTKLVMQYLAAVNSAPSNLITEQILEAAPLLEAFGNAKTVRNDNSSRFGKYLQIRFRDGVISGAKITEYLLEKSRIVTHSADERNYHVFYEVLKGLRPEEKEKYGLTTAENYFYLNQGGNVEISTKDDSDDLQSLLSAMQVVGFTLEEQDNIFRILAAVLHLGNIYFHRKQLKHGQEGVEVGSDAEVRWVSHLLQIDLEGILKSLTWKTTEARRERLYTPLNIDAALDARDAVAKALYSTLFSWLVSRINAIVNKGPKSTAISILDIFGFEDFQENSFEQLCINYANENLQFYFNKHIFKLEQQEYAKEKIDWQTIDFTDNMPVIQLLAKKPVGIFHLLDDESNFPKATDASLVEKCHYNHALNELYSRPRMSSLEFGIKHYAGQVWYNVEGFLDKNRDTLRPDVLDLLISSQRPMLSRMFQDVKRSLESGKTLPRADGRFVTMKPRTPTVAARFQDSLTALLESMSKSNPWFVRCLKPNQEKAPMKFDMPLVLEQLRYSGMLETIRIRKLGFPVRLKFSQFSERYKCLAKNLPSHAVPRDIVRSVLEKPELANQYQIGTSKIFLRETLEQHLEKERLNLLRNAATKIQTAVRSYLARRKYRSMRSNTIRIQAAVRGWLGRRKYQRVRRGIVKAQAHVRGSRQRRRYKELKEEMQKRAEAERVATERAQQKAAKEEQERVAKYTAGFNHLEIPAELAFIFSKLDEWQQMHTERNVVKVVGSVPTRGDKYQLPPDIDYHPFSKFTNIYFKSHLWAMKKEPIQAPFLSKNKDVDVQDSLSLFKLILRFMNDTNLSGKKEIALGNYIVNKGLLNEKLRDEIFCQLCNQTWNNDNEFSLERGWFLLANCLSAFPPSSKLYKYLLKYVSDYGYNGYKALCQQKLLQSARLRIEPEPPLARSYPPSILEWKANRKRVNMALEAKFADNEARHAAVDSWSTAEDLAALLLQGRGIEDSKGWSISMSHGGSFYDLNGHDYVLDVIAEMETPPAFPVCKSYFLLASSDDRSGKGGHVNGESKMPPPPPSRNSHTLLTFVGPPPQRPASVGVANSTTALSRHSALNARYFDDQGKSKSLDNLLEHDHAPTSLAEFGLSKSRLNDRYRSMERLSENQKSADGHLIHSEFKRHSGRASSKANNNNGSNERWEEFGLSGQSGLNNRYFEEESEETRKDPVSEDDFEEAIKSHNHKFIKSQQPTKKPAPGSHSSRAYIDKYQENVKSSGMSDTSETPSIGNSLVSHVRRVRVPSQSSDVDQFLDDLFMPVLDGNIDELSDARSLAASIKGGGAKRTPSPVLLPQLDTYHFNETWLHSMSTAIEFQDLENLSVLPALIKGGGQGINGIDSQNTPRRQPSETGFTPIPMTSPLPMLPNMVSPAPMMLPGLNPLGTMPLYTSQASTPGNASSPAGSFAMGTPLPTPTDSAPLSPFMPYPFSMPLYSMQGFPVPPVQFSNVPNSPLQRPSSPGAVDPAALAAFQQNLQRVFLQSAVAQNMQIQQQLVAQNQALQQLLQQSTRIPPTGMTVHAPLLVAPAVAPMKANFNDADNHTELERSRVSSGEPVPPPVLPKSSSAFHVQESSPFARVRSQSSSHASQQRESRKSSHSSSSSDSPQQFFGRDSRTRMVSAELAMPVKGAPPPPPMPPEPIFLGDPTAPRPFVDPYGRAKTVRIGKWRWPPRQEDVALAPESFLEFKFQRQNQRRSSANLQASQSRENSEDGFGSQEWDAFEASESSESAREVKEKSPGKEMPSRPVGSIGKLKLSSEMRAKLEMVTSSHTSRSKSESPSRLEEREKPEKRVKKLEDNRKLMLQQQLGGGKWKTLEEIQLITQRSQDGDFVRMETEITERRVTQGRSASPSGSYYSPESSPIPEPSRKFSKDSGPQFIDEKAHVQSSDEVDFKRREITLDEPLQTLQTKIYGTMQAPFFTYNMVPWTLHARKEVFYPGEILSNPLAIHLVFCQIVRDTFNPGCIRIGREERIKMKQLLENYGVSTHNLLSAPHKNSVKKNVIELARSWTTYFSRLHPVSGGRQNMDVQYLAVSDTGIRLVKRDKNAAQEELEVLDTIPLEEVADVRVPRASTLQLSLTSGSVLALYSHRALLIRDMIDRFLDDHDKSKGHDFRMEAKELPQLANTPWNESAEISNISDENADLSPTQPQDGKHSLLQFAMIHFRQSPEKFEILRGEDGSIRGSLPVVEKNKKNKSKKNSKEADWTWKDQVEMVKFTKMPIQASLLRVESSEENKLALECFLAIMRYMGDYPMGKGQSEVDSVYTILMNCHKYEALRDEVYCQIMKQTTNNKSAKPDSCQRGWRLFTIVAAYFKCSETLKPFLLKYLETAAYDKRRAYHGTAMVCLQNLRKTLKYSGRKNVPSIEEITAITAGRNSKRQIYRLPGGTERVINTKSTSVVQDIIEEICAVINVRSPLEMEEYSLYCIVEGDTFTMPLAREEYILDVTTELQKNQQVYYLIFCRSVWHFSLRLDNPLYVEVVFNQIAPDYLEGLLLVMPGEQLSQECVYDIAKVGALLHKAAALEHVPAMKETKYLLPKPALSVRSMKPPQWVHLVQSAWQDIEKLTPLEAKSAVLQVLSSWDLFGSSFFAVQRIADPPTRMEHILALNKKGVHFLDVMTHETLLHYPYSEVISTRKVKSEDGALYLDMKCGNLMQQKITRIQTDQAHEIARLIRQYITIEQKQTTDAAAK